MTEKLIPYDKSIIVAADIHPKDLREVVSKTYNVKGIGGYKVGMQLTLRQSLEATVKTIREFTDLPVIYDHQKGGCDTSDVGEKFAEICKEAGINGVILFPLTGSKTEKDWIKAAQDQGLTVIIGAHMIQPEFFVSDDGWIDDAAPEKIFRIAAEHGVKNFVLPGSKLELIQKYTALFNELIGKDKYTVYLPGIPTEKEAMATATEAAGNFWHGIIGRAITQAEDISTVAEQITNQI